MVLGANWRRRKIRLGRPGRRYLSSWLRGRRWWWWLFVCLRCWREWCSSRSSNTCEGALAGENMERKSQNRARKGSARWKIGTEAEEARRPWLLEIMKDDEWEGWKCLNVRSKIEHFMGRRAT